MSVQHVTSADGTSIAYESYGEGPAVLLVAAANADRAALRPLAQALAAGATAITYDRRGRGESTDAAATGDVTPVAGAVERELEDLDALVDAVGGTAALLGYSSGAHVAALGAVRNPGVQALVMFEPPFAVEPVAPTTELAEQLAALVAQGRRGDAVAHFMSAGVGLDDATVAHVRGAPFFPAMEAMANSLVYDAAVTGLHDDPRPIGAQVTVPTLALHGRDTWPGLVDSARAAAAAFTGAELRAVDGADHDLRPDAVAPQVLDLLARVAAPPGR
ncbi:alpha/beta fold hydrolase [Georgenia subflava]|uniref:Alpha/beta fold hydrolase n=1 Tax=Georgenia subflava TaxID=1622177 RepID=A0A6N7EHJ6_9MICO|nr:alpha/beta hydrolase [Georgenia subflava]MPV36187.1 alpha/beta fold hydrolase [Georgenia subflava]